MRIQIHQMGRQPVADQTRFRNTGHRRDDAGFGIDATNPMTVPPVSILRNKEIAVSVHRDAIWVLQSGVER